MVRAFTHGAMGHRIDPSWWTHWAISHSSHCSTTGMCYPVCGMVHIKEPLLLIGKSSLCGGSRYPLSLSLTISKMCWVCPSKIGFVLWMERVRCSSVIDNPFMVRWVVWSISHGGPIELSRSSQCSMTGATKVLVCKILCVMVHYKRILAAN